MHKHSDGTWKLNNLEPAKRPCALPDEWGAYWFANDLSERSGHGVELAEALYALGITAYQYALTIGEPPEKFFVRAEFCPWPEVDLTAAPHEEPQWQRLDVAGYVAFMRIYEGGLPPDRILELVGQLDLLCDYLVACGELDDARRQVILADAQRAIDALRQESTKRPRRRRRR